MNILTEEFINEGLRNAELDQNIMAVRTYTGLKYSEVKTRIKDLELFERLVLINALKTNNPNDLDGYVLQAYNSLSSCQDFNILFGNKIKPE